MTRPGLKHIAFFEAVGEAEEHSAVALAATAGLLLLRLVDHWVLAGSVMVEPESVSVRSVRSALMRLDANDASREVLLGIVNAMQSLREVDLPPLLPRLFAYAGCLEQRAELKLASDVYETVTRLSEESFDADLLIDSYLRLGYCHRMMGQLDDADAAYSAAGRSAARQKQNARMLRARVGSALVVMVRGNLPMAEALLEELALESERLDLPGEAARALQACSTVIQRRGELERAVAYAYRAFTLTSSSQDRDLILGDIAGIFVLMSRFEAARDAIMVLDATTTSAVTRQNAQVNMVALAARANDQALFWLSRERLEGEALHSEARINYLIESARGFRCFGKPDGAEPLLREALALASEHGLTRSIFEAEAMLSTVEIPSPRTNGGTRVNVSDAAASVERELRKLALAVP